MMLTWSHTFPGTTRIPALWLVENGVLHADATNFGVTTSNGSARFVTGTYFTVPSTTVGMLPPGTGDFTMSCEFSVQGVNPTAGSTFTSLLYWSTWASGGQPINYEFLYDHQNQQFTISVNNSGTALRSFSYPALTLNTFYKVELSRQGGILSLWVNGVKHATESSFTYNFVLNTTTPMKVGRRIGGTGGEVSWWTNMTVKNIFIAPRSRANL